MRIKGVKKSYRDKVALDVDEIEVPDGAMCAVVGMNGCGKSTLLKVLAGLEKPDEVELIDVGDAKSIGYMPQHSFGFKRNVWGNMMLGVKRTPEAEQRAESLLKTLDLWDDRHMRADRLSGGQTEKLALGRVLMRDFDLLLLDEPTSSMDISATLLAEQMICDYKQDAPSRTFIIVTHSIAQAERICEMVVFMDRGRVVEAGSTEDVLHHPQRDETRRFLEFSSIGLV